jgi:hypothetical protein
VKEYFFLSVLWLYLYQIRKFESVEEGATRGTTQEAKYVEGWPSTTSAWTGLSRFYIPVDRYDGVHSLLRWPSRTPGSPTCH